MVEKLGPGEDKRRKSRDETKTENILFLKKSKRYSQGGIPNF